MEQYDFVLRSQVAEKDVTPAIENERSARQLIEYMLERARNLADAMEIFAQWRKGNIVLISENKNILVKEAIRKRCPQSEKIVVTITGTLPQPCPK